MKFSLVFFIFIASIGSSCAQDRAKPSGQWLSKYGLLMDFYDSFQPGPSVYDREAMMCTCSGDSVIVHYMPHGGLIELHYYPAALFRVVYSEDSIILIPLDQAATERVEFYRMPSPPTYWHDSTPRLDYFPNKAQCRNQLVFYPVEQMAEHTPWEIIYLSMKSYAGSEYYDLTIYHSGLVRLDLMDNRWIDSYFGFDSTMYRKKSYELQLTALQMDTLNALLNIKQLYRYSIENHNFSPHSDKYALLFNGYDALFSLWSMDSKEYLELQGLIQFMESICHKNRMDMKELPFTGFQSPCTFIDSKK